MPRQLLQHWVSDVLAPERAVAWAGRLESAGVSVSMDGRGWCLNNVFVERLWRSVKREIEPGEMFATREQARAELFEYLEVLDNHVRRHSSLGF